MGPANEVLRLSPSLEFHRSAVAVTRIPTCVPEQVERIPDVDGIRRLSWLSCMISLIFPALRSIPTIVGKVRGYQPFSTSPLEYAADRITAADAAFTSEPDPVAHPPLRRSVNSVGRAAAQRRQPFSVSPFA